MSLNLLYSLQFDVEIPTLRNVTSGEHEAASSVARAPSRADSWSEEDEPTEEATTARRKAETIDEPSRVRCYVHRCNGRCSLGDDAGSNAAGLHGDTLTLLQSSAWTSVIAHAPAENQIFLQSGPVWLSAFRVAETDAAFGERADGSEARAPYRPTVLSGPAEPALLAASSSSTILTLCAPDKVCYTNVLEALLTTYSLETIHLEDRTRFSQLHFKGIQTLIIIKTFYLF